MHEDGGDRWSVKICVRIACLVDVSNSNYVMVQKKLKVLLKPQWVSQMLTNDSTAVVPVNLS